MRRLGRACIHATAVTAFTPGEYLLDVYVDYGATVGDYQLTVSRPPVAQEFAIIVDTTISDGTPAAGAGNIEQAGATDICNFTITSRNARGPYSLDVTAG